MLFNSYVFIFFLLIVLPIFYLLPQKKYKKLFLLFAGYFFYGYWDYRFCALLAISTIVDFVIGRLIYNTDKQKLRSVYLIISMCVNLGILGFFKYFNFFIGSFTTMASTFGLHVDFLHLNIILPVGISFYTFQTMSYTIDIYREKLTPTNNFVDFALFVSFFPQLVAGPIERAADLLPRITACKQVSRLQIKEGLTLVAYGFFKKVMIGDTAGRIVDHIFINPDLYASSEILAAILLFSVQIYADFSGYSCIARGTGKLLGIELMENFKQPYLSSNITEFWRRWHISLSSWLRDYLYIPLGGNKKGVSRTYINLMATMLLGGLWHGASWNFVIWGALHGIYLVGHKLMLKGKKPAGNHQITNIQSFLVYFLKVLGTYCLVQITWFFFRITDMETARIIFEKLINWQSAPNTWIFVRIVLGYIVMMVAMDIFEYISKTDMFILKVKQNYIKYAIVTSIMFVSLLYMIQAKPLPFVYFQF